jgi:hypothetical protein
MTLTYTKYYRLPKTDFLSEPWIQGIWDSFDAIDLALYGQAQANGASLWANGFNYVVGNLAIDSADASTWLCAQLHTSAIVPTTFAQDRAAHPSYWTPILLSFRPRGQWMNNTAYHVGDMAYDTAGGRNTYGICATNHTSNASGIMNDDAVYWSFTYNSMAPGVASTIGYDNSVTHMVATNVQTAIDESFGLKAPLASPTFTGAPTAPTVAPSTDNSTKLATTAFVQSVAAALGANSVRSFNGRVGSVALLAGDVSGVGGALLASPAFTGVPSAPTPVPATDNTTKLATTAFVQSAITQAAPLSVQSWNGRNGAVTMTLADITSIGGAPINSPALTGTPTAPTAPAADSSTKIATTAFVQAAMGVGAGVTSWNGRAGAVNMTLGDITSLGGAPINSPAFTGTPTAPTVAPGTDSSTKLATTAFVQSAVAAVSSGVTNITAGAGLTGGGSGNVTVAVAPAGIDNTLLATMPAGTIKGNNTGATAAPVNLTQTQAIALLGALTDAPNDASTYGRSGGAWKAITPSGGLPGGLTTQVQFNNAGAFGGDASFTYDNSGHVLRVDSISTPASSLFLTSTGGSFGSAALEIGNNSGKNGAVFSTSGVNLVDFVLSTGAQQVNMRYETRSGQTIDGANAWELQFGIPSAIGFTSGNTHNYSALPMMLAGDPTAALQAATKQYVDSRPITIAFPFAGKPAAGAMVVAPMAIPIVVPSGLASTKGYAMTAAAASAAFTLNKITAAGVSTALGTITAPAGAKSGFTLSGAGGTLAAGDSLQLVAPGTQDTALADLGITLLVNRG